MPFVQPIADLQLSPTAALFQGVNAGVDVSFFITDHPPGSGPDLHFHPYAEVFIVQEGEATFTVGDEQVVVTGGHIAIVPPETPHGFKNSGEGRLRQVSIHTSPEMIQTELT